VLVLVLVLVLMLVLMLVLVLVLVLVMQFVEILLAMGLVQAGETEHHSVLEMWVMMAWAVALVVSRDNPRLKSLRAHQMSRAMTQMSLMEMSRSLVIAVVLTLLRGIDRMTNVGAAVATTTTTTTTTIICLTIPS